MKDLKTFLDPNWGNLVGYLLPYKVSTIDSVYDIINLTKNKPPSLLSR